MVVIIVKGVPYNISGNQKNLDGIEDDIYI